jgi:hypothetical protein
MLRFHTLVTILAAAQAGLYAQSIPQAVSQLQADVQALKNRAFTNGTSNSVAPPTFSNIEFFKGYATFKNSAGRIIANLGVGEDSAHPGVWLTGDGNAGAYMRVFGRTGELNLLNNDGKKIFFAGEQGDKRSGVVRLFNAGGQEVFSAGTALEGSGGVWVNNQPGKQVAFLGASTTDIGRLTLSDTTGNLRAKLDATGNLVLYNSAGKDVAMIGMSKADGGGIWLENAQGEETVRISTADDGSSGYINLKGRGALDYAEVFESTDKNNIAPGSVVSMTEDGRGIALSGDAYDPRVVGVIAGAGGIHPAVRIGLLEDGSNGQPVAIAGQVFVRVSTEGGAIVTGDLLVASRSPGVAMRSADPAKALGSVVGKALQPYSGKDEGLIRMLVMTH